MQLVKLGSACPGLMLGQQRPDQKLLGKKKSFFKEFERNDEQNFLFPSNELSGCLQAVVETRNVAFHWLFPKALHFPGVLQARGIASLSCTCPGVM